MAAQIYLSADNIHETTDIISRFIVYRDKKLAFTFVN